VVVKKEKSVLVKENVNVKLTVNVIILQKENVDVKKRIVNYYFFFHIFIIKLICFYR